MTVGKYLETHPLADDKYFPCVDSKDWFVGKMENEHLDQQTKKYDQVMFHIPSVKIERSSSDFLD